jgi:hypothetical protein
MSMPCVSGIAVLFFFEAIIQPVQIKKFVMCSPALAMGSNGWINNEVGYGIVKANTVVDYLNNNPCSIGSTTTPTAGLMTMITDRNLFDFTRLTQVRI